MNFCVECRWCELKENKDHHLRYRCERLKRPLDWDVIRKKACKDFRPQAPSSYWGP